MGAAWIIALTGHHVGIDRPGSSRKALPDCGCGSHEPDAAAVPPWEIDDARRDRR